MLASTLAFSRVRRVFRQSGDPGYGQSWLGALLFAAGTAVPFAFDAATSGVSAVLLLRLPVTRQPLRLPTHRTTMREKVREGIAWLWRHTGVRAFAIGAAVVNMAHTGAMAIVVLLVRDRLHASDLAFGLALTGAAIGSIMGAELASWIVERTGRRPVVRASIGTISLSLLCIALAPSVEVVAIGRGTFGAAGEVWHVVAVLYRQALVPDHLLGRVMATYRVIAYGAMPVGAALGGLGAKVAGVRATFSRRRRDRAPPRLLRLAISSRHLRTMTTLPLYAEPLRDLPPRCHLGVGAPLVVTNLSHVAAAGPFLRPSDVRPRRQGRSTGWPMFSPWQGVTLDPPCRGARSASEGSARRREAL